jgi:signal transduction histidine kinase
VHELIDDIEEVLNVQPLMSDVALECRLEAENDKVLADSNQLRQVFLNLIINATDAISSGDQADKGKLLIQSALVGETPDQPPGRKTHLKIMFIDNGPGIPEENIGNIFDPFFSTKEPGKGTGLGLSVSFMMVEGFGGKMTVSSDIGQGTTMTLLLPVVESESGIPGDEDFSETPLLLEANGGDKSPEQ